MRFGSDTWLGELATLGWSGGNDVVVVLGLLYGDRFSLCAILEAL
jgi:hypothetical protein